VSDTARDARKFDLPLVVSAVLTPRLTSMLFALLPAQRAICPDLIGSVDDRPLLWKGYLLFREGLRIPFVYVKDV
jgi:hypothetical protein